MARGVKQFDNFDAVSYIDSFHEIVKDNLPKIRSYVSRKGKRSQELDSIQKNLIEFYKCKNKISTLKAVALEEQINLALSQIIIEALDKDALEVFTNAVTSADSIMQDEAYKIRSNQKSLKERASYWVLVVWRFVRDLVLKIWRIVISKFFRQ